ncbi:MAG TPA: hypothetical protein VFQ54_07640, partial [Thermomicrobiales bacterium]|nr:hypothetical protein [Thermomicrobiales bacterium]
MARNNIPPDGRTSSVPEVPRPTGVIWEELAAEGVVHESQVLIVGLGADLPARLILTRERLALVNDGEIAIEVPRTWLRPSPKLAAENGVRIYMTPTGPGNGGDTETLSIRAR